jgi:TonB family protein
MWLMAALALAAQDFEPKVFASVGPWVIGEHEFECAMSAEYKGGGSLALTYDAQDTESMLVISDPIYAGVRDGQKYELTLRFIRRGRIDDRWGTHTFVGSQEKRSVYASYNAELLDDIAAADTLVLLRGDSLAASLSLRGSASAVAQLAKCAAKVARERRRDPFAAAASRVGNLSSLAGSAEAKGNPASWVTTDDYPPAALLAGDEGSVGVSFDVNAQGRVVNCSVTSSSGSSLLDMTTCRLVERRGRYSPALDAAGNPIAGGRKSLRYRWNKD